MKEVFAKYSFNYKIQKTNYNSTSLNIVYASFLVPKEEEICK